MLERHILADKVAAFTALACDGDFLDTLLICLVGNNSFILGLVEDIAWAVSHTAVN